MGKTYLIDTNIVMRYLNDMLSEEVNVLIEYNKPNISVITRIELLSWGLETKEQTEFLKTFVERSEIINLDEQVILTTIEVRKKKRLKLPDAIIAATAISKDMILITSDASAFKSIKNLRRLIVKI